MNRKLVLEQRDVAVAAKITEYLKATDRYAKRPSSFAKTSTTPPACARPSSNANADLCAKAQIRGADHRRQHRGEAGARQLHRPRENLPGHRHHLQAHEHGVDAQTCKLIVLDQGIKSMTLFKQIIGRGTGCAKTWANLVHHPRLQARHQTVCRQGL